MILITGATGQLGNTVINFLLRKGIAANKIAALVRSVEKADALKRKHVNLVYGDYDDYASLVRAFEGIEKLLFVPGRDLQKRLQQNENVVKAAIEASVKHFVYAGFERKNETETSPLWMIAEAHLLTEKLLKESGIAYTILKNNLYMDFIPDFIGKDVLQTGTIYLPAANGKVSAAMRSEMAEAAAVVLSGKAHENKIYDITNTEAFGYADVAKYLSEITGKKINYVSLTKDAFMETLANAGVADRVVGIMVGFALAQAQGDLDTTSNDLENLIGRKPVSLKDYLKYFYKAAAKP